GPARIDLSARPVHLSQDANVVVAVAGEVFQVAVQSVGVELVPARRGEKRRTQRVEVAGVVDQRAAIESNTARARRELSSDGEGHRRTRERDLGVGTDTVCIQLMGLAVANA